MMEMRENADTPPGRTPSQIEDPAVAVIMRSKNEQPYTDLALEGLKRQTYRNYILYNVDSGSTDGSFEAVQRNNLAPERVVQISPEEYFPPGRVLNSMIERTREPIIVFQNADAVPLDEFWLERLVRPIIEDKADATMSRQVARRGSPFIVVCDMERAYGGKNCRDGNVDFFSAVACAFRRTLWEETKFFTLGYAEDLVWSHECKKKGARFKLVTDSAVEHSHSFPMKGLYRKRYPDAISYAYLGEKPNLLLQSLACAKEMVRDLIYAVAKFRPDTIPYNLVYRATIHWAYHRGKCDGWRLYGKRGKPE